jgi:hypothetical protein
MSGTAPHPRQGLVVAWLAQMVGTVVIAVVVAAYVKAQGAPFAGANGHGFERYIFTAILGAAVPALWFLRPYKARLDADAAAMRSQGGVPDPVRRNALLRSLAIGGALCELPMAVGALDLFLGGDSRWFIGATFVTLAMRLSYRPFVRQVS